MATVIDSLIIQLGLDPKNLTKGQQQAIASFRQSQQQMLANAKSIEDGARRITEVLHKLRNEAIGFMAGLVGAAGIKEFFSNMVAADADLGRFARSLGMTVEEVSKWQNAMKLSGGTAEEAASSVKMLSDYFQKLTLAPEQTAELGAYLRQLNVYVDDLFKGGVPALGDFEKLMLRIAKATEGKKIPQMTTFLEMMGMPRGAINLLTQGEAAVKRYLATAEKLGPTNERDAKAAREFEAAWEKLSQAVTRLGHTLVTEWGPKIAAMLDTLTDKILKFSDTAKVSAAEGISGGKGGVGINWNPFGTAPAKPGGVGVGVNWSPFGGARVKPGAGEMTIGTAAMVRSLMAEEPQLKEFTALRDAYHTGGKHAEGLAVDFTIRDAARSIEVIERLRQKLAQMGVDAYVKNEYLEKSPGWTAPHIHMQFQSAMAAQRYAQMTGAGIPAMGGRSSTSNSSHEVNINGDINVNAPHATDAKGIAGAMGSALKDKSSRFMAGSADGGPN